MPLFALAPPLARTPGTARRDKAVRLEIETMPNSLWVKDVPFIAATQMLPQTSCAVSITNCSFLRCACTAMLLPCTVLEKPHWGESAS